MWHCTQRSDPLNLLEHFYIVCVLNDKVSSMPAAERLHTSLTTPADSTSQACRPCSRPRKSCRPSGTRSGRTAAHSPGLWNSSGKRLLLFFLFSSTGILPMSFGGKASQPGGVLFPLRVKALQVLPSQPRPQHHEGRKPKGKQVKDKRSEVLDSEATHATGGPTPRESGESHEWLHRICHTLVCSAHQPPRGLALMALPVGAGRWPGGPPCAHILAEDAYKKLSLFWATGRTLFS